MPLASRTLHNPNGTRKTVEVQREANFGDFLAMERNGWLVDGDIRPDCELQARAFLIWQLCGLPMPEVETLGRKDFAAVWEMVSPFVSEPPAPESGAANQPA